MMGAPTTTSRFIIYDILGIETPVAIVLISTLGLFIVEWIRGHFVRKNQRMEQTQDEQDKMTAMYHADRDGERLLRIAAERELMAARLEIAKLAGELEGYKTRLAWFEQRYNRTHHDPPS